MTEKLIVSEEVEQALDMVKNYMYKNEVPIYEAVEWHINALHEEPWMDDFAVLNSLSVDDFYDALTLGYETKTNNTQQKESTNMTNTQTTNPKWEEIILVSPRKEVFNNEELTFQGVIQDKTKVEQIVNNMYNSLTIMRRGGLDDSTSVENNAEINYDYKQPIPYVLVKRKDEIFVYERLSGGGETRLHGKMSIGVGGHANEEPNATSFEEILMNNVGRELEEELNIISSSRKLDFIGLINDDENQVGKVHLGILAVLELSDDATVEVNEVEQLRGHWMTVDQLKSTEVFERLESWSQIAVEVL